MAKKVIRLTEDELKQLIKEATARVMNEMDAPTYSRIHNASHRAMQDIQNGNYERSVNDKKKVDNDDIISKADELEPRAQAHWLKDYVGQTFKFFGRSQMGLPAHVLFTFERITKLEPNKTVLVGSVTFNRNQINGDGIIIDFVKGRVKYHERGNRYAYNLEIDNRYKQIWDAFTNELRAALDARQY
jgi:hypothetical protein